MQQRVGLARAFATDAPILLMDEPFSALDPLIRARLQDELLDLQKKLGRTILFVSHDLDEAFKLGDRIAIMEGGRIVQHGTPRDIYQSPANDYVADFVAHMNPLGVLRAGDVMTRAGKPKKGLGQTDYATPIKEVMKDLTGDGAKLTVTKDGTPVGTITREAILDKLLDPRANP
jgi:glycine betaine/proline transport system ATP-binding protein